MSPDVIHFAAEARRCARTIISVPWLVYKTRDARCFSSATFEGLLAAFSLKVFSTLHCVLLYCFENSPLVVSRKTDCFYKSLFSRGWRIKRGREEPMEVLIGRGQWLKWGEGEFLLFLPRAISAFWNLCKISVRKCSNGECGDVQLV